MKTKILSFLSAAAIIFGGSACQDPYEFTPEHHDENILSLTASFYNDDSPSNSFAAEIDYAAGIINIVFPYTYPPMSDSHLEENDLTHVRVQCNLENGSTVEPELTWLDLTKDHHITVTGLDGDKREYTITSEIRKSRECEITDFSINALGLSGAINAQTNVITLISADEIGEQNAEIIMSHGATISPDPRVTAINFDQEQEFTVTAQNGVDKRVYKTVKGEPTLIPSGANFTRATVRWAKKLTDYGYANGTGVTDVAAGLAVVGDYVIINKVGLADPIYVNAKTGEKVGTIDLSSIGSSADGYLNNYRMTSDNNNNIVISNFSKDNGGTITVWKKKGLDGAIEQFISYAAGSNVGDQLSVVGDLDGDAIITATVNGSGLDFFRWVVTGGALQSQTPEKIHVTGYEGTCWGNADVAYVDPSNPNGDYITGAYMKFADEETANRGAAYVNGASNTITSKGSRVVSSNWVINAVDVIEFNHMKYAVHNSINTFTWGGDDNIYVYDLTSGDLATSPVDFGTSGLNFINNYGALLCGATGLARNGSDVKFSVAANGVYLYIYFLFANGYVGCVQVDCLDM